MNPTLELLSQHRSDRSYTDEPVSASDLDAILAAAHRAPTSFNSHQISLIVTAQAEARAAIAKAAGGQPWIAKAPVFIIVVADLHKTRLGADKAGQEQNLQKGVEALLTVSIDAGIALEAIMTAARSLGLGVVPIGGLRRDQQTLIELFGLPSETLPLVGVAIGHVDKPAEIKPRMAIESFAHRERYDEAAVRRSIDAYDEEIMAHWRKTGRADGLPWSTNTAGAYKSVYFPNVKPTAAKQGFTCEE